MSYSNSKMHIEEEFKRVTNGIKLAPCMKQMYANDLPEIVTTQLESLAISGSLSCSFCNALFENQAQQRLHYKLDWHRYNLKQRLHGLKSISEDRFDLLASKDDVSSISGSESESESDENVTPESSSQSNGNSSNGGTSKSNSNNKSSSTNKKIDFKLTISDSSDEEYTEEERKKKKEDALMALAYRHSKVFFENKEGHIFSIYRCLLHSKKDVPKSENEMIRCALDCGLKNKWIILMLGGGHFAAAVFSGGEAILHKTFHYYTVRAKQGSAQNSRDNRGMGSHPKSAGASLRRYNETALLQHVQNILESWIQHIENSSIILYRAVGPFNRSVLFGGKNPALDKNDSRLRPLPFPTRRATYNEVNRVHDILSSIEVHGLAANFPDSLPISPRQPLRKKKTKGDDDEDTPKNELSTSEITVSDGPTLVESNDKGKIDAKPRPQKRKTRANIDRAKPRKSPSRPLPEIVSILAGSSSESESEEQCDESFGYNHLLTDDYSTIDLKDRLQEFEDTVPQFMKNKKFRQKKRR